MFVGWSKKKTVPPRAWTVAPCPVQCVYPVLRSWKSDTIHLPGFRQASFFFVATASFSPPRSASAQLPRERGRRGSFDNTEWCENFPQKEALFPREAPRFTESFIHQITSQVCNFFTMESDSPFLLEGKGLHVGESLQQKVSQHCHTVCRQIITRLAYGNELPGKCAESCVLLWALLCDFSSSTSHPHPDKGKNWVNPSIIGVDSFSPFSPPLVLRVRWRGPFSTN